MLRARLKEAEGRSLITAALLCTISTWGMVQVASPPAIAADSSVETFKESNAINGILCIAACNEFFEAGQASFELEIRNLQSRAARAEDAEPLLQVDPKLLKTLEEQRDAESR